MALMLRHESSSESTTEASARQCHARQQRCPTASTACKYWKPVGFPVGRLRPDAQVRVALFAARQGRVVIRIFPHKERVEQAARNSNG